MCICSNCFCIYYNAYWCSSAQCYQPGLGLISKTVVKRSTWNKKLLQMWSTQQAEQCGVISTKVADWPTCNNNNCECDIQTVDCYDDVHALNSIVKRSLCPFVKTKYLLRAKSSDIFDIICDIKLT